MGDHLSQGVSINTHICGNEEVYLLKTTKSVIIETLPLNSESKAISIGENGFSFKSSDYEC